MLLLEENYIRAHTDSRSCVTGRTRDKIKKWQKAAWYILFACSVSK